MNLFILKTNVETEEKVTVLAPVFDSHPQIYRWSFDLEDVDNVLKLETNNGFSEKDVLELLSSNGFKAEELAD